MAISQNSKKNYLFFFIFFVFNVGLSNNNYTMTVPINDKELPNFYINNNLNTDSNCKQWIPSLYNSFLLIFGDYDQQEESHKNVIAKVPALSLTDTIDADIYFTGLLGYLNVTLGVIRFFDTLEQLRGNCYLGLSNKIGNFSLDDDSILIYKLGKQGNFRNIFSFDKWEVDINKNEIKQNFYVGYEHSIFTLKNDNDGIIGECDVNKDYKYWGCSFSYMIINNNTMNTMNLTKSNGELYKIYFSSENHNIIFPKSFLTRFNKSIEGKCSYDPKNPTLESFFLSCNDDLFNSEKYISLKLISEDMEITIEIDNKNNYRLGNFDTKNKTRIRFESDTDDFILPLIMFKKFHIQFDAEKNKIKFYTTNSTLLKNKKEKKNDNKKSSNVGTIFLIIFIIILILAIAIGVFWFVKKRKNSLEKNINKYNKFDEDDNFQNMNEQRVF